MPVSSTIPRMHLQHAAQQRSPIQDFLDDDNEPRMGRRIAEQSYLPSSHIHQGPGCFGPREDLGTSLLVSSGDCTRLSGTPSQELPALTPGESEATRSVNTSIGTRQLVRQRILEQDAGGALVVPSITETQALECPFHQLLCLLTFSNKEDWISHSLTHFQRVPPPQSNKCCFCSAVFQYSTGERSWRKCMEHIAIHHQLGCRLATARPDFELFYYLWRHRLISDADYRDLKGNYDDRSRRVQAYPSLPDTPLNQQSMAFCETERRRPRRERRPGGKRPDNGARD
ncbi:hypothetical protein MMC29_007173 [Sticta canariensis]|nr:hypothetical protein [Sticta canariensis]